MLLNQNQKISFKILNIKNITTFNTLTQVLLYDITLEFFLTLDDTPYEIKERGLDAVNNFHSACLNGGSKSIYRTRLVILGQEDEEKKSFKRLLVNYK